MTTGFSGAPLAKIVFIISAAGSLALQASRRRSSGVALFLSPFAFRHLGETLFGLLLQYHFRVFERQIGSAKFGAYLITALGVGQLLRTHLAGLGVASAAGPFALIFANLVEYTLNIPPAQHFDLLGWRLTDKVRSRAGVLPFASMAWASSDLADQIPCRSLFTLLHCSLSSLPLGRIYQLA